MHTVYRTIDLFAGIGGIKLGFDRAFGTDNISTVFASEIDKFAQQTYTANYISNTQDIPLVGDITKVAATDIPQHDILLAGFPCQAFSLAGKQRGFEDTRGTLFFDVARIVQHHQPQVVFAENVKNLVSHNKGTTFKVIKNTLQELGYRVFTQVLNSKDFGVPQNRERIYIVAFRNDIAPDTFDFPTGITGENQDQLKNNSKFIAYSKLKDILEATPIPAKYYLSETYYQTLIRHKQRHQNKGNGFGYEIRNLDGIAGTIVCGGMGHERNLIIDPRTTDLTPTTNIKGSINTEYIRKMTPREWSRLQSFPDDFKFVVSDTQLYKQFANSVTVNVIQAIASKIKEIIEV